MFGNILGQMTKGTPNQSVKIMHLPIGTDHKFSINSDAYHCVKNSSPVFSLSAGYTLMAHSFRLKRASFVHVYGSASKDFERQRWHPGEPDPPDGSCPIPEGWRETLPLGSCKEVCLGGGSFNLFYGGQSDLRKEQGARARSPGLHHPPSGTIAQWPSTSSVLEKRIAKLNIVAISHKSRSRLVPSASSGREIAHEKGGCEIIRISSIPIKRIQSD
ncbi:uncharacterized protein VTP21DRAFT_7245 [Calcarisporiella thermophila]|uniref:uncharacterized protein n=1 Tax=Calcarisporiella thermophila TaxID=911321 RepID=UPI003744862A